MTELGRYTAWRERRLASRPPDFNRLDKPGYVPPPIVIIMVPDSRSGAGGGGFSPVKSLQTNLQLLMQGWVGMYGVFDPDLMKQLISGAASDSESYLGSLDPDTAPDRVDQLVKDYAEIYRLAATPV